jgi:hypothetical protein
MRPPTAGHMIAGIRENAIPSRDMTIRSVRGRDTSSKNGSEKPIIGPGGAYVTTRNSGRIMMEPSSMNNERFPILSR